MCSLEKRGNLFILTLTGTDEHRFNPTLLDSLRSALARVKAESSSSTALITTSHGKFFSNGYDLSWASQSSKTTSTTRVQLMSSKFRSLVADMISLPMPTIAAVTGHASASGFILALSHDYVLMRKDRGFLYMSELDIGLTIPAWFVSILNCKIGSAAVRRDVLLRAAKMTAEEAVVKGVIDSAYNSAEETVEASVRLGMGLVERKWEGQVYGQNRKVLMADVLDALKVDETVGESSIVASRL